MSSIMSKHAITDHTIGSGSTLGYRLNAATATGADALALYSMPGNFRFLLSTDHPVEMELGDSRRILGAPCMLWSWEGEVPRINVNTSGLKLIVFHPNVVNGRFTYDILRHEQDLSHTEFQDLYFLRPFLDAGEHGPGCLERAFAEVPHFLKLFANLNQFLFQHDFDGWPCQSRATIIELMFALRRVMDRLVPECLTETQDELVSKVAFSLQSRLAERVTLVDLAHEFATNRTTLNEHFQAAFGCGVMEFQRTARLRVAQAMLKDTFLPIETIMERVGYEDASSFGRAFRTFAGCSPSEYRNSHSWMLGRN